MFQFDSYIGIESEAVQLFEESVFQYVRLRNNPVGTAKQAIQKSRLFILPKCIVAMLCSFSGSERSLNLANKQLKNIYEAANELPRPLTEHEKLHILALEHWLNGSSVESEKTYEMILTLYPKDLLSLKLLSDVLYFSGKFKALLNITNECIQQLNSLNQLSPDIYGYAAGIHAFALEENGQYDEAIRFAKEAISINKDDVWAIHAVAHVHEMRSEWEEGVRFLNSCLQDWETSTLMGIHIWWHKALFLIELERYDECWEIFNSYIHKNETNAMNLVDATSFLWRLELKDVPVDQSIWINIAKQWESHVDKNSSYFNLAHATMAMSKLQDSEQYLTKIFNSKEESPIKDIGVSLCSSVKYFTDKEYLNVIETMPPRCNIIQFGGSNAQRDIFCLTKIKAAERLYQSILHQRIESLNNPMNAVVPL